MQQSRGAARGYAVCTARGGMLAAALLAAFGCTPFLDSLDATLRETSPEVATILDEHPSNAMSVFGWDGLLGPPRYLKAHVPKEWAVFGSDVTLDGRTLAVGVPGDAIRIPPPGGWPYPPPPNHTDAEVPLIPGSVHLYDDAARE